MRIDNLNKIPLQSAAAPLFTTPDVHRQPLGSGGRDFNYSVVHFGKGVRNKFHTHASDQILVVTKGTGIVATEKEEREVGVGDVVLIPAGEKHWHGAKKDTTFAHIAITRSDSKTTQLEP